MRTPSGLAKIAVPEARNAKALAAETLGPDGVGDVARMLAAIGFKDELGFETNEIRDIRADGKLAPELMALQPTAPQHAPERLLRICHGGAQSAGICYALR